MIITVQIGNTDNKLSQQEWSAFVTACNLAIRQHAGVVYFAGGSPSDAPYQNHCWVFGGVTDVGELKAKLVNIGEIYRQDNIAWTVGRTELL